jgi:hypothetical protein
MWLCGDHPGRGHTATRTNAGGGTGAMVAAGLKIVVRLPFRTWKTRLVVNGCKGPHILSKISRRNSSSPFEDLREGF